MAKDFDLDWANFAGQTGTDLRNTSSRGGKAVAAAPTGGTGDRLNLQQDVTTAVNALYEAGQSYIILQWTGNAGAADLYGKGAEAAKQPTLVITTANASTTTSYTVNYVLSTDGTTVLKDATVHNDGIIGQAAAATDAEKANFWVGAKKYIFVAEGSTTSIASLSATAAENQITLKFREAASWAYTVSSDLGTTIKSGTAFEGEKVYVPYPEFELSGTTLKQAAKGSSKYYEKEYVITEDNQEETINYDTDAETDVVFYKEAEDLDGVSSTTGNNANVRCSKGTGAYFTDPIALTTLPAGKYKITAQVWGGKNDDDSKNATYTIKAGGETVFTIKNNGNLATVTGEEFTLANTTNLILEQSNGGNSRLIDLVYIKKTSDLPANEKIVVTDAGYATYVSNYNLDFTSATTKAYKVHVGSKGVATLTEVAKVPAKTPVLLYAEGGNGEGETIPVTTDAIAAVTENDLVAGTGATVATTDGDNTNMILNNVSGIGFYFANGQTVAANRAYLHILTTLAPDAVGGSRGMSLVFADDVTGISATLKNKEIEDKEVYNLKGQRVAQPTKGLYIVSGKKVIIK